MPKKVLTEEQKIKSRATSKAWREKNPEQSRANIKRWMSNPDNVKRKNERQKSYYEANFEKYKKSRHQWHLDHPEYSKAWHRQYYANNKRLIRGRQIEGKYGITLEQYDEILKAQGGGCATCGSITSKSKRTALHIDHDHVTGEVRGILCHHCNVALGSVQESLAVLQALANYLQAPPARPVLIPTPRGE